MSQTQNSKTDTLVSLTPKCGVSFQPEASSKQNKTSSPTDFKKTSVEQWGYSCGSDQEAAALVWPVRFKPAVTVLLLMAGLVWKWPVVLIAVGGLGILGTLFQRLSWIDFLYNAVAAPLFRTPRLGPDPSTRRWLCGVADLFVLLSGVALSQGHSAPAYGLGGAVVFLAGSVVLTGICLPAYLFYKWKKKHFNSIIVALVLSGTVPLFATDGYFQHGYGIRSKGMGGVGVAFPQDAVAPATNPAGLSFVENRLDIGLDFFRPIRETSVQGNADPTNNLQYDASEKKNFFIPEFGANKKITPHVNLGLAVYGNGGMNTSYTRNITLFGSTKAGVDLSQAFLSPAVAVDYSKHHALGVGLILAYQRFKATGLENFDNPGISQSPGNVTNNGYDSSTGWGARFGWLSKLTPKISLGATYQTKIQMGDFKNYKGLFAENGGFDIPENYSAGIAAEVLPRLTVAYDLQRIKYSGIRSVGSPLLPGLTNSKLGNENGAGFGWRDITVQKVGVSYGLNKAWTVRAGYNHSQQPIPPSETFFNLLAPGVVQDHLTLGATWKFLTSYDVSLAYAHAFQKTVNGSNSIPAAFGGGEANLKMYEDSFGVALGYRFN